MIFPHTVCVVGSLLQKTNCTLLETLFYHFTPESNMRANCNKSKRSDSLTLQSSYNYNQFNCGMTMAVATLITQSTITPYVLQADGIQIGNMIYPWSKH